MKMLCLELQRSLRNPWFYIAIILTVIALWMGLGTESYWLLHGAEMDAAWLLETTFTSSSNALSLPILAALPGAASARKEIRSGAVRHILFRSGMRWYIRTRVMNLLAVTALAQFLGMAVFTGIIAVCTGGIIINIHFIVARLLSTMLFALLGSAGALMTQDTTCAYAIPDAVCFTLSMLRSRFLLEAEWLDPVCWLQGSGTLLWILCGMLVSMAAAYSVLLRREVKRHV